LKDKISISILEASNSILLGSGVMSRKWTLQTEKNDQFIYLCL